MYDAVIIGAGVTGCACAMELSYCEGKVLVLEKESDVCCQTSKANSGIVHAGYDAKPGSRKAEMNVRGAMGMEELCRRLDIPYVKNGSLVISNSEEGKEELTRLLNQGKENGVKDLQILGKEELLKLEPHLSPEAKYGLYAPTAAIVCPFELTIAMGEVAAMNGVEFHFHEAVTKITRREQCSPDAGTTPKDQGGFRIETTKGIIETHTIINAAGVYADEIHNMVSSHKLNITPRKGEYYLLDKEAGEHVSHTIFSLPTKAGKGVLVAPTTHGNLLVGPNAVDIGEKEGTNTTGAGLLEVLEKSSRHVADVPLKKVITSFAGLRAHEEGDDFIIGEVEDASGFFDCVGIESPGLSSAPAIGEYMAKLISAKLELPPKNNPVKGRKGVTRMRELPFEKRQELVKENPSFGTIVCRCEEISEGEIIEAIRRPLGATTIDGIKRRTRAGMGRCQAGFCLPKTMEILARETNQSIEDIQKNGEGSKYLVGKTK